jgi:hypothetical protein
MKTPLNIIPYTLMTTLISKKHDEKYWKRYKDYLYFLISSFAIATSVDWLALICFLGSI